MQPNYAEAAPVYAAEKPAWVDQQIEQRSTPSTRTMARKKVDWEAVELRFRAGTESLRSIGASFITQGAIRQRAKKESWSRDLQARVRDATNAVLLRKTATPLTPVS